MGQLIRDSCATIAKKLVPQEHNNETTERVKRWLATDLVNADRKKIQTTLVREWKERWQREVDRSRARHRGRAEEPADEPPTKERLKLPTRQTSKSGKLPPSPDENRQERTPSLPVRTPGAGCDDSSLFVWRWPGDSAARGSILPAVHSLLFKRYISLSMSAEGDRISL